MMASMMSFPSRGHRFEVCVGWTGQEEERCLIYREHCGGSRRHGTAVVRRHTGVDDYVQDGGAVWRRGGVDDRPSKEDVSDLALEMEWWKMVEAASESAPDRYGIQSQRWLGWGIRL
ncbi:u-box domain-containing protein 7 [Hordeum vulgare]|nr:u-box domain-containing protein 7 [Hordeum vulgare]